jgi:hypothetical protein
MLSDILVWLTNNVYAGEKYVPGDPIILFLPDLMDAILMPANFFILFARSIHTHILYRSSLVNFLIIFPFTEISSDNLLSDNIKKKIEISKYQYYFIPFLIVFGMIFGQITRYIYGWK